MSSTVSAKDLEMPERLSRKRSSTESPTAKRSKVTDQLESFVSSKRTSPQLFVAKRQSEENVKVFPQNKENQRAVKTAAQKKADDEKLAKIVEKSRSRPAAPFSPPIFPSTMDLLDQVRTRNLEDARKNGPEEAMKKKKRKRSVRNNYWRQFR